jgi:hypothetical protein
MNANQKLLAVAMVCVAVLTWGFCLWPTLYRFETVEVRGYEGQKIDKVYRVHRLSGQATLVVDPRR